MPAWILVKKKGATDSRPSGLFLYIPVEINSRGCWCYLVNLVRTAGPTKELFYDN